MQDNLYDITIIGGGPVGMFAGFYAGLRSLKVQLIESLPQLGGQLTAIYPEKTILDVAGFAGVTGQDLIEHLQTQLKTMPVTVKTNQAVTNIEPLATGFQITTPQSVTQSKTIIIATGGGAFEPRKLAVPNLATLEANGQVEYTIPDLAAFRNQTVVVAGGGNSAVDNALLLEGVAKQVYLIHRRSEFQGLEQMLNRLNQSTVKVLTPYLIKTITPADDHIIINAKQMQTDDQTIDLVADRVLVNYGFVSSNKVSQSWQLDLDEHRHMFKVANDLATNVDGVYAVGDSATYEGKDTLIATGFGEVPLAINQIAKQLYPDRHIPIHSTAIHH